MLLVVDANILISALISRGFTLELFFSEKLELLAPDFIFEEIKENKDEILQKSGLAENELELFLSLIITRVEIVPFEDFKGSFKKAKEISPDPDDVQYFALALIRDCGIWSNEERLTRQSLVKIWKIEDVAKFVLRK